MSTKIWAKFPDPTWNGLETRQKPGRGSDFSHSWPCSQLVGSGVLNYLLMGQWGPDACNKIKPEGQAPLVFLRCAVCFIQLLRGQLSFVGGLDLARGQPFENTWVGSNRWSGQHRHKLYDFVTIKILILATSWTIFSVANGDACGNMIASDKFWSPMRLFRLLCTALDLSQHRSIPLHSAHKILNR